jgi:predicted nucleic acid-binding Zn ribbon protein
LIVDRKMADYNVAPNTDEIKELPECEHTWQKVIEASTFVLQGSGWFKDGYDGIGGMKVK